MIRDLTTYESTTIITTRSALGQFYYRATHTHSRIARYIIYTVVRCPSVCMPVRLSHCMVYCVEITELIIGQLGL